MTHRSTAHRRYPGARYRSGGEYEATGSLFDGLDEPAQPEKSKEPDRSDRPEPPCPAGADIYYMSFGSGSSGNCSYVGTAAGGVLVDAGVDPDYVFAQLQRNGILPEMVRGVVVTHDHGDHIRYLYKIVRTYRHISVYATPKAFGGIMRRHSISRRLRDYHKAIYKEFPFEVAGLEITAFEVSHDGSDNAGFFISHRGNTMLVATDLGCITDRVDHYARRSRYMMIEANYDLQMLRTGTYAEHLKARIATYSGHLDNAVTAEYLGRIYTPSLRAVFLCHLSNDNNTPQTALDTVRAALRAAHPQLRIGDGSESVEARAADLQLLALPRYEATPLYRLR